MNLESSFTVNGTRFNFRNSKSGLEEIDIEGEVLSSKRSIFGATHKFNYNNKKYEIKIIPKISSVSFIVKIDGKTVNCDGVEPEEKIPLAVHIMCGWPIASAAIAGNMGGSIAGAIAATIAGALAGCLGGVAYAINMTIYKSKLENLIKVILNILTGCAVVGVSYLIISQVIMIITKG